MLKYIPKDYIPKGQIQNFPLEVIDKMLERQVEQDNKLDVSVFEKLKSIGYSGFMWHRAPEGNDFWLHVIENEDFDVFFEKYPKKKELPKSFYFKFTGNMKAIELLNALKKEQWRFIGSCLGKYYGRLGSLVVCFPGVKPFGAAVELTEEEFISYFEQSTIQTQMKTIVPVTDVLRIHSVACTGWKNKIAAYLSRTDNCQNIHFQQSEIEEMFAAATNEQLPLLEEIFGKLKKPVDLTRIKTGSKVMIQCTGEHCNGFQDIDSSKPVDVVFFKTPHFVDKKEFKKRSSAHPSYTTFHQDGKFVLFAAEREIDYITEVIEY